MPMRSPSTRRSRAGLTTVLVLGLAGLGVAIPAAPVQAAGCAAFFDADGDGHDDLVVGTPLDDVTVGTPQVNAGSVTVVHGDADGMFGSSGSTLLTQEDLGLVSTAGDRFGTSVATADLDGDGCADLAIGAPGENAKAGAVVVLYGSPTGLDTDHPQVLRQGVAPVGSAAEPGDQFGASLAVAGSLPTGGPAALWVGSPGEGVGSAAGAGMITELRTSPGDPVGTAGAANSHQDTAGVPGSSEPGDHFGERLAGSASTLLVGTPHEDSGSAVDVGQFYSLRLSNRTWASYSQGVRGMPGAAEAGDTFGSSLAILASCSGTGETWAIGSSGEAVGTLKKAGAVMLWDSGAKAGRLLVQGKNGVPDSSESGDAFGATLVAAAQGGGVLVVGAPGEDVGSTTDTGAVTVVDTDCRATGPDVASAHTWNQGTTGVDGTSATGNRFGAGLGAALVDTTNGLETRLVVGSPGQAEGAVQGAGNVTVFLSDGSGPVAPGSVAFGRTAPGTGDGFGGSLDATNALLL